MIPLRVITECAAFAEAGKKISVRAGLVAAHLPVMMMAWDRSGAWTGSASPSPCWSGACCRVKLLDPAGGLVGRFEVPDGWAVQAFAFALD